MSDCDDRREPVDMLIEWWHTEDHGKALDESASDLFSSILDFIAEEVYGDGPGADLVRRSLGLGVEEVSSFATLAESRRVVSLPAHRRLVGEWRDAP